MKKLSSVTCPAGPLAVLMVVIAAAPMSIAQFPGMPQPKHYPWSDTTLSPDARADLVIKEMTLEEKISLLHGQGFLFNATGPTESNGGAGYSVAIPRLGIPAIQMADSAYGVTRGLPPDATPPRCPTTWPPPLHGIRRPPLNMAR